MDNINVINITEGKPEGKEVSKKPKTQGKGVKTQAQAPPKRKYTPEDKLQKQLAEKETLEKRLLKVQTDLEVKLSEIENTRSKMVKKYFALMDEKEILAIAESRNQNISLSDILHFFQQGDFESLKKLKNNIDKFENENFSL